MAFKKQTSKMSPNDAMRIIRQFPHCDQRILHAPGECQYCDGHPDWQALRLLWGIAFTGWVPEERELPCPADHARGDTHTKWGGNVARPVSEQVGREIAEDLNRGRTLPKKG